MSGDHNQYQKERSFLDSLKDATPCCGQYETCWRACTPRGRFLGQRDAQREWVGLTVDEIQTIAFDTRYGGLVETTRAIEAKLKEKNHG